MVIDLKTAKIKRKIIITSIIYIVLGAIILQNIGSTSYEIYNKMKEKREFTKVMSDLKEKEEELKGTVTKLQDPDYVARYAREKYLFSKNGEIIIRIPD